jgi:caspase 8
VKDRERLEQTFNKLGYKVIVKTDLNSDQMQTAMRDAAKETNSQNDSFVCCILSHGNAIGIEGVDYFPAGDKNDVVTINELGKLIDCSNCPALADKPKIFFIQACRGDERPEPAALDNSQSSPVPIESTIEDEPVCLDGKRYLPPEADFLFSYSTCQDNAATRLLYSGSDYITQLCYAINKYSSKLHLSDILMVVHHDISRMGYEINGKLYHQMPEIRSTLRGHFKFSKQLF